MFGFSDLLDIQDSIIQQTNNSTQEQRQEEITNILSQQEGYYDSLGERHSKHTPYGIRNFSNKEQYHA